MASADTTRCIASAEHRFINGTSVIGICISQPDWGIGDKGMEDTPYLVPWLSGYVRSGARVRKMAARRRSHGGAPSVYDDFTASNEGRFVGRQIDHGVGDVLRTADTSQRRARSLLFVGQCSAAAARLQ